MIVEFKDLLSVADIINSSVKEYQGERYYLTTGNLSENGNVKLEKYSYKDKPSRANQNVKTNDIIVARMKNTNKVLRIKEDLQDIMVSTGFVVLRAKNEVIEPSYLELVLKSKMFQNQKDKYCKGATQKAINNKELSKIKIPILDKTSQSKLVNLCKKVTTLIQKRKAQIEALDQLTQSVFLGMFGDPVKNDKQWNVKKFGNLIDVLTDYHANGSYKILKDHVELLDTPDYALMVRTTDLENQQFEHDVKYISEDAYHFLKKTKVYGGEIIINKIGSAGKVYLMPNLNRPVSLGMNQFMIRVNDQVSNIFIYHLLNTSSGEKMIQSKVQGAVTKTITKDAIRDLNIIVPPIELQQKYEFIVTQIQKQKNAFIKGLEELDNCYKSLMQKAFNGELFTKEKVSNL